MGRNFDELFRIKKPIIGMIHLAGGDTKEKVKRALEELEIYQEEDVNAAIIEDYHGTTNDVLTLLNESAGKFPRLITGVNILKNPYSSFFIANHFGVKFVQFDSVQETDLVHSKYERLRNRFEDIVVLGGVGFKYTKPAGNHLSYDLYKASRKCEAIVTTGDGTGIETPIKKLMDYKKILGSILNKEFPLIVGAWVNLNNVHEQLEIADGAIVGSYFKNGNTQDPVVRENVRNLMSIVKEMR